ncbi:MAG: UDP-N-acetylmuramoyl-L-alanyl-D-glutamate--2,6-diaminopimelate ligase [Bacteroidetes bacterium]|nr:MAG: UDP-N-acetylmuramoyl-L-alanyl-D-glutamate--2,6-diaminopimelate ligase [Bacteroidota bacterium]
MKKLTDILYKVKPVEIMGAVDCEINQIQFDSRKVNKGDVFVAVSGTQVNGHTFISKCIEAGATAIVCENLPDEIRADVCYVQVEDSALALGQMSSNYYDQPSNKLKLVGITGTNGKTSTVTMLFNLYQSLGYQVGLLSTVSNRIGNREIKATHTTPDAIQLNGLLAEMVDEGCDYCFMEVSSHAIVQKRIAGLDFTGGIFSNITHDHLDFHKTFKEYIKAKKAFFDGLSSEAFALTNADDKNGNVMLQNTKARKLTYGLNALADYKARIVENSFVGLHLEINNIDIHLPVVGKFNAYNILAVYGTAMELGADKMEVLQQLSLIRTAEGRFEYLKSDDGIIAIVDYAHTPDALKNVLSTINDIREGKGQLICVVGAGGDRDKTKRPEMAEIAAELSDRLILTSDNPRTEEPEDILDDMEAGVPADRKRITLRITDRKQAIRTAVALAQPGDIVLVAGKGHEKYQEVNGVRHHFDDKEILTELLIKEKK